MSPLLEATQHPDGRSQLFRMSVEFYHELGRLGMLSDKGWELLDGIVVERMPKSPLHEYLTEILVLFLGKVLGTDMFVSKEHSISTRHSEPIPDVVVLKGQPINYALQHPHTALLVMEVSVTSEKIDLAKSAIYADAAVAEYWIINPTDAWIEVHSKPAGDSYAKQERFAASEVVTSQSVPGFTLRLADIMPNQSTAA